MAQNEVNKEVKTYLFHPTAVIILILLDWGGFLFEVPQIISPVTLIFTFILIFLVAFGLIYMLQQHFAGDSKKDAVMKGLLGGLICAVPAPVMASFIGSIILALSGFENIKQFGVEGLKKMFSKQE
jgi:hypothetical protein